MIVDAQVHLWLANTPERPWLPNRVAQLPEPFLIEQLVPMMDEAGVDRAVIVPPSWEGDRNDYALEAVRRYPTRFAVMGRIPVNDPNIAKLLPDWKKQPGMLGLFRLQVVHRTATCSTASVWALPLRRKRRSRQFVLALGEDNEHRSQIRRSRGRI